VLRIEDCDILIGIFGKRFGTPVNDAESGTEHEFRVAYASWKDKGQPHIQVYFNQKPYTPKTKEETDQWGHVLEFKKQFPMEGLWWHYKGKREFEGLVRKHLTQFLRTHFSAPNVSTRPSSISRRVPREQTARPFDVSQRVSTYLTDLMGPNGAPIRRNLLIFETDDQRTWLSFTSAGLLCVLDNRRRGGEMSVRWFTRLEELRSAKVEITRYKSKKRIGLLSIGDRRDYLFTKRLFADNLPLKQIIQEEIRKLP
jgi:hypothetical protein